MNRSNDKQGDAKEELRCDPEQLALLKKCSAKKDMTEWNNWHQENPNEEIWLQGANLGQAHLEGARLYNAHLEGAQLIGGHLEGAHLSGGHLEGAHLFDAHLEEAHLSGGHLHEADLFGTHLEAVLGHAHLEGAVLEGAHLQGAWLEYAHLEGANFWRAHLERADFTACSVDGLTSFWECSVDRKTNFRGVGLDSCRIDEPTKYLLKYNIRRMNCEDWYKQHPRLAWPVKAFFWFSDYGNSTWRIIKTFLLMAICFAIVYYLWGAVDCYLLDVAEHPGIVANLFVDRQSPVLWWLVPLRSIYFSIVTMTTLGFGDMYANTSNYWFAVAIGHVLLGLQVLLGYVLLGALVTRFGVLFTSGLIPGQFKEKQEGHQKV